MKNCLLVFRNKKLNNFDGANDLIISLSSVGYYFDKVSFIAYDSSDEIISSLKDGKDNYENLFVYCPSQMQNTLKKYLNSLYNSQFNEIGILKAEPKYVFMLFSDCKNRLLIEDIKQILDGKCGVRYEKDYIKTVGASSECIKSAIHKVKHFCHEMEFNISESYGESSIQIIYPSNISKNTHNEVLRTLMTYLNEYVYAIEDISLADRLYQLIKLRRMKISVAESFTGGGISKKLVEIPGVSEVYYEGLNTYSNEAKMQRLGVNKFTLQHFGAVSKETAREMAEGLLDSGNCDLSIATTGIAGPKSDNTSKPVGLIYIAVGTKEEVCVYKYNLKGDRDTITNTAINLALFLAYKTIK